MLPNRMVSVNVAAPAGQPSRPQASHRARRPAIAPAGQPSRPQASHRAGSVPASRRPRFGLASASRRPRVGPVQAQCRPVPASFGRVASPARHGAPTPSSPARRGASLRPPVGCAFAAVDKWAGSTKMLPRCSRGRCPRGPLDLGRPRCSGCPALGRRAAVARASSSAGVALLQRRLLGPRSFGSAFLSSPFVTAGAMHACSSRLAALARLNLGFIPTTKRHAPSSGPGDPPSRFFPTHERSDLATLL
jgi:hypothetical protein